MNIIVSCLFILGVYCAYCVIVYLFGVCCVYLLIHFVFLGGYGTVIIIVLIHGFMFIYGIILCLLLMRFCYGHCLSAEEVYSSWVYTIFIVYLLCGLCYDCWLLIYVPVGCLWLR